MALVLLGGYSMRHPRFFSIAVAVLLSSTVACVGSMPPPPELTVTSPQRGMVQESGGRIEVRGTARPGPSGDAVARVTVNGVQASLAADGSFVATVDVPAGATLLETIALSDAGAAATDARAVQVGQLRPTGAGIERAVTAALSADAFTRLSAAASDKLRSLDLSTLLAPMQPIANLGDSLANVQVSITRIAMTDTKISLVPVDGGLQFTAEIRGLSVAANARYGGSLVPDGATTVSASADTLTIAGTLVVTPAGVSGFTTKIASPTVRTTALKLQASGLVGTLLDLLNGGLSSILQRAMTSAAESAMTPLINDAFGALAGPQQLDILGKHVDLEASPSAVTFSRSGAVITMNLQVKLAGSEGSRGFIYTPNGVPAMTPGSGIQLGLADDLVNELLAQVHALGILDINLAEDLGLFDRATFKAAMPPMISANNADGTLRLVIGDMVASFTDHGAPVVSAAVNAQVDMKITRGAQPQQIALEFGKVHVFVNPIADEANPTGEDVYGLSGVAAAGVALQLDSLQKFLITVPVPAVAGVSLDSLSLRADSGYLMVSGQIH